MSNDTEKIIDVYTRHALAWAALRNSRTGLPIEAEWLDRFLNPLPPSPSVLDIGCGSNHPIATYLAAQACQITGVDSSPGMIALCKANLPGHIWLQAHMRALSLRQNI